MSKSPRPRAALAALCLALATAGTPLAAAPGAPAPAGHDPRPAAPAPAAERRPDPMLAFVLGAVPLASGYYLTSTPQKGLAFSLADAVILGAVWNIRRDETLPDRDVGPYFVLLGAVNAVDALLSLLQARADAPARLQATLTPDGEPKLAFAFTF